MLAEDHHMHQSTRHEREQSGSDEGEHEQDYHQPPMARYIPFSRQPNRPRQAGQSEDRQQMNRAERSDEADGMDPKARHRKYNHQADPDIAASPVAEGPLRQG